MDLRAPIARRLALVVASPDDRGALLVAAALRARLGDAVRVVTPEELVLAPGWNHALGDAGGATETTLASGLVLRDGDLRFVLSRARAVSAPHFARSRPEDLDYALSELHALLFSWLASLACPVVNRPHAQGLAGRERSSFEWSALAARAGLPVRGFEAAFGRSPAFAQEPVGPPAARALVVGGEVHGDLPAGLPSGCLRLARCAGCDLLEASFATGRDGSLRVASVSPFPALDTRADADRVARWLISSTSAGEEAA